MVMCQRSRLGIVRHTNKDLTPKPLTKELMVEIQNEWQICNAHAKTHGVGERSRQRNYPTRSCFSSARKIYHKRQKETTHHNDQSHSHGTGRLGRIQQLAPCIRPGAHRTEREAIQITNKKKVLKKRFEDIETQVTSFYKKNNYVSIPIKFERKISKSFGM